MSLKKLIEVLVEETLTEVNSISAGGASLLTPDSIQGFQADGGLGFGGGEGSKGLTVGAFAGDVGDENFDQMGEKNTHHKEFFKFFWNGDDPDNEAPKVRYVAV